MSAHRAGLVALAGRPNVGKSTLANALADRHVAAVSPRPQTTRRRVSAVVNGDGWQAVLLDLPGFQRPGDRLTARMQATVDASLPDADAALLVLNAAEPMGAGDRFIAGRLAASRMPVIVVVNKIDQLARADLAPYLAQVAGLVEFRAAHPVSAAHGDGLGALRADLAGLLPAGPALFPAGMATDQTDEELTIELIREAALNRLREEIPHALAVELVDVEEARRGLRIAAHLLVETESQKRIVVGRAGAMVRDIGIAARASLARLWGTEVHLELMVRVRPRWRDDDLQLDRLGL